MRPRHLLVIAALAASALGLAGPAAAKGGTGGGGGGGTAAVCGAVVVTNNGQTVKNQSMPEVRYSVSNCGTQALAATVTITEAPGFLSVLCPAPVAAPVSYPLVSGQKVAASAPVFRGACGERGPANQTVIWSSSAWQGHNLLLTLTDDATGAVLGTSFFSWQDQTPRV